MAVLCTATTACPDPKTCEFPGHAGYQRSLAERATAKPSSRKRRKSAAKSSAPKGRPACKGGAGKACGTFRTVKGLKAHNAWAHKASSEAGDTVTGHGESANGTRYEPHQSGNVTGEGVGA